MQRSTVVVVGLAGLIGCTSSDSKPDESVEYVSATGVAVGDDILVAMTRQEPGNPNRSRSGGCGSASRCRCRPPWSAATAMAAPATASRSRHLTGRCRTSIRAAARPAADPVVGARSCSYSWSAGSPCAIVAFLDGPHLALERVTWGTGGVVWSSVHPHARRYCEQRACDHRPPRAAPRHNPAATPPRRSAGRGPPILPENGGVP